MRAYQDSRNSILGRTGGIAAAACAGLLIVGASALALRNGALTPWLAVLFGINGGVGAVSLHTLHAIKAIDVVILLLAAITFSGLGPRPLRHRNWYLLAVFLPIAGIAVLFATGLWGRSGLMSGAIVLCLLMLTSGAPSSLSALGLFANLLLLVGDFATQGPSTPIAIAVGAGYVALTLWFAGLAWSVRPRRD